MIAVWIILLSSFSLCVALHGSIDDTELSRKCMDQNVTHQSAVFPGRMTELSISEPCGSSGYIEISFENETTSFAVRENPGKTPSFAVYKREASSDVMCVRSSNESAYRVNISLNYCPPAFFLSPDGICRCQKEHLNPNIVCIDSQFFSGSVVGHCVTRTSGKHRLLVARCAYVPQNSMTKPLVPIPQDNVTGKTMFCEQFNRVGKLCNSCKPGHGLSVFSDTFECIPCKKFNVGDFFLFLVIEIVPTTVFVFLILFFHIGITSGPANAYIFFSQMITTPIQVLFLMFGWKLYAQENTYLASTMPKLIIFPYCIWNLTFYRIFYKNMCLHPDMRVVHVLALRLGLALYPLLLVMVAYVVIELKARNIRVVTWLWWLVCFNCVRWRRVLQAKTSVVDAFASCVLLSYTKLVQESMVYLAPSQVTDVHGKVVERVLAFDTAMTFFGSGHRPYVAVAIIMLLLAGVLPPVILTLYQFGGFQNFLDRLRLRGVGMQTFVEAFQGCYKDGTEGTTDCRFFAGLYFVFRCIAIVVMAESPDYPSCFTANIIVLGLFLYLLAIFQPYKKKRYNIIDSGIIFLFITISGIQLYLYSYLHKTFKISHLFLLYYFLLMIPFIYILVHILHWLHRKWKERHNRRLNTPSERQSDFYRESVLEERVPLRRESSSHRSTIPSQTEVSISELSDTNDNFDNQEERVENDSATNEHQTRPKNLDLSCARGGDDRELGSEGRRQKQRELQQVTHYGTIN